MLGRNPGYVTTQGQILADLLVLEGYHVTSASSYINRIFRLGDIVKTVIGGRRNFDLVVLEVYSGPYFVIADVVSSLCRWFRLPLAMVLHGGDLARHFETYPRWTTRVLKNANRLVAPSSFLADQFAQRGFDVDVIPNVVDIHNYPFRERRRICPNLLWMRSFHSLYNPAMAVRVLAQLKRDFPDATLTMAGVDKGLESEVKQLASDLGLENSVRFPGFLDNRQKADEFARADIYLHTNRVDNMPVSVVEAGAFGLPIVGTRVGGVPYLIKDEENGLLVQSDNTQEMVGAVKRLLADVELVGKLSRNGRVFAEKSGWTNVKAAWEELFETLIPASISHGGFNDEGGMEVV